MLTFSCPLTKPKQGDRRYQTVPLVLPHRQSLSICPISITFVTLIMGIHDVILKTEVHKMLHCHHMTEDQATAIGKKKRKFCKVISFLRYMSRDTHKHTNIQTDRHAHRNTLHLKRGIKNTFILKKLLRRHGKLAGVDTLLNINHQLGSITRPISLIINNLPECQSLLPALGPACSDGYPCRSRLAAASRAFQLADSWERNLHLHAGLAVHRLDSTFACLPD